MKKIFAYITMVILFPFTMIALTRFSKEELVAEFEDFHNERGRKMSEGTWTDEDEREYESWRTKIIEDYGKRSIKHLK